MRRDERSHFDAEKTRKTTAAMTRVSNLICCSCHVSALCAVTDDTRSIAAESSLLKPDASLSNSDEKNKVGNAAQLPM